jgi:predicted adenylyl cyclase CyaB
MILLFTDKVIHGIVQHMKSYEVELRSLLSQEKYDELKHYFDLQTTGVENNADAYVFLTSDLNIKVKKQTSKGTAKITVKKGAEYKQDVEEFELPISPADVEKAISLITALGFEKHIPSVQKRTDYDLGEIMVSLKDVTNWGPHIEVEIVVEKEADIAEAKKKLEAFLSSLGLTAMTEKETQDLINSIIIRYGMKEI